MTEFPEGKRPEFSKRSPGRMRSADIERSKRFDQHLLQRYNSEQLTYADLAKLYRMGTSTIRDRIDNARRENLPKTAKVGAEARRRQAKAWRKAAVLLDAVQLTSPGRKDEMQDLAMEALQRARAIDDEVGEP